MTLDFGTGLTNSIFGDGIQIFKPFQETSDDPEPTPPPKPLTGPFINLGEIESRPLEWIWEGWIPRGKLTLVVGEPGVGKSLFALYVASMVSRGRRLPSAQANGLGAEQGDVESAADAGGESDSADGIPPGTVLMYSAEDSFGDTIRPRLDAAQADLSRVFRMSAEFQSTKLAPYSRMPLSGREFESIRYFDQLEACLNAFDNHDIDVPLVIIDPVERFMNCNERGSDLPEKVTKLVRMANRWNVAIVALANSNLPSPGVGRTAYRSATIGNEVLSRAARSVLLITHDRDHEHERLVLPIKQNLGEPQPGMRFTIQNRAVVADSKPTSVTSEQYFALARQNRQGMAAREEISELQRVMSWLQQRLSQGAVRSSLIRKDATENAITSISLRRAFRHLECVATKAKQERYWVWQLPKKNAQGDPKHKSEAEATSDAVQTNSRRRGKSR
ncbi:AAA family ATPase [Schlesneria paludicola]|uniref:AAA family ATPase n=1 Tax=Schlesneria paludicola TaxID=360056 RepID=UPI00029B4C49|nr:AAA family ATPase [Schlesneria paludicola]